MRLNCLLAGVAFAIPTQHFLHAELTYRVTAVRQNVWHSVIIVEALITSVARYLDASDSLLHY